MLAPAGHLEQLILRCLLLTSLISCLSSWPGARHNAAAEQLPLTRVLPKLESLHEEVRLLLIKNSELKDKISANLQAQNKAKMEPVQAAKMSASSKADSLHKAANATSSAKPASESVNNESANRTDRHQYKEKTQIKQLHVDGGKPSLNSSASKQTKSPTPLTMKNKSNLDESTNKTVIDYNELEDFNKWVELNLEYAVKNTQASAEAFKEEALQNNGTVDYSDQAMKDGLEGVKYWQSAVMFQEKTLSNEKFDMMDVQGSETR